MLAGNAVALQPLALDWLAAAGVEVAVLRLDQLDPELSGNKWFKLDGFLREAAARRAPGLIGLGGAHSNHLHALAAAGRRAGLRTVGLLRGEPCATPTVDDLTGLGMQLHWLGFGGYRARHRPDFWAPWQARYPGFVCIPEGGGGYTGARGCASLVGWVEARLGELGWDDFDGWWLAAGTGTTLAGLVLGECGRRIVHGALAVKPPHGVEANLAAIFEAAGRPDSGYRLLDACRGGFARFDAPLARFLRDTESASGLPLEPVYTAKALMALQAACARGEVTRGSRLVFVHTGGLQGRRAAEPALQALLG